VPVDTVPAEAASAAIANTVRSVMFVFLLDE